MTHTHASVVEGDARYLHLRILDCPTIHWTKTLIKTEIQCLQRELQCPPIENESCVWTQSLLLTLHRRPPTNVESSRISNDTGHRIPFGTICHGCGSLPAHFESLTEGLSGLLLLCHLSRLVRKTLILYSLNASQDTVDQASTTSEL